MADAAQERLTEQLQTEVMKFEKECMRDLQVEAFKCSIKCCQDKVSSSEVVQRCVAGCQRELGEIEHTIHKDIERLQDRLSRCAKQCEDNYNDRANSVGPDKAKEEVEPCLVKCCDSHTSHISSMFSRLRSGTRNCH